MLLFANTGAVNTALIDAGVQALLDDPSLDSAATVSPYDRWNPRRAFREADGRLTPYAECLPEAPELSWLGDKIMPLKQGVRDSPRPEPQPKLAPAPKPDRR